MTASEHPGTTLTAARADGRDARWKNHRQARRHELVEAAVRAIREHGPSVGMDEISATAGTSKTVIYRHLGDRLGLYLAVCESVDARILRDVGKALEDHSAPGEAAMLGQDPRAAITAITDSYLRLVERDPEVYRFVTRRPLVDVPADEDPVSGLSDTIAIALAEVFAAHLPEADSPAALTWAHALVGAVRESADRWLVSNHRQPRADLAAQLADLAAYGLTGVLGASTHTSDSKTPPATSGRHSQVHDPKERRR
ncbi:TetR/AcrR family transcriptional regulator [Dermacoccaceae bacterium W4C1]